MDGWKYLKMYGWMEVCKDGWKYGWMMEVCKDGWMDGCYKVNSVSRLFT